jgi:hypothetical protein
MSRCSCRLRGEIAAILAVLSLLQTVTMVAQDVLRQRTPGALTMSYDLALGASFPVLRGRAVHRGRMHSGRDDLQ